jgi:hypothetical protein
MITKFGKRFITSYLANGLNFNQKDIAIGIGSQAPTLNDSDLQFEFYRSGVFLGSSDIQTNTATGVTTYSVVYKTTLPTDVEGIISEIGIFPTTSSGSTDYSSQYISSFEDSTQWKDSSGNQPPTVSTPTPRIGSSYFSITATAGQSKSYSLDTVFNLSGYGVDDSMTIAFYQTDLNLDYVYVRFYSSPTNYKEIRFPGYSSVGQKISLPAKMSSLFNSTFSSAGATDFSAITTIEVGAKAKSSGATNVLLDGLRINDDDRYNSQYGLISRSILTSPIVKKLGVEMDIEYKINLGFL